MNTESIDNVKKEIEDKLLKNPFYGTFIIYWVLFNWKLVFILVSFSGNYIDKLNYIDKMYDIELYKGLFFTTSHLFLLPFLMSILSILLFPFLTNWFYKKREENKNTLKIINEDIEQKYIEKRILTQKLRENEEKIRLDVDTAYLVNKDNIESEINKYEDKKIKSNNSNYFKEKIEKEKRWKEFYNKILKKRNNFLKEFDNITDIIFYSGGNYEARDFSGILKNNIESAVLSFYIDNKVIELSGDRKKITFTDKGQYILDLKNKEEETEREKLPF